MEKLKRIRGNKGLTQEEVANAVGVSRSTVAMWETGATYPRGETLIKLADLLGCTIDEFYSRDQVEQEWAASPAPNPQPETGVRDSA